MKHLGLLVLLLASLSVSAAAQTIPTLPGPSPASRDLPVAGSRLTLPQALHLAMEHNPDILSTQLAIGEAEASLHLAEITYLPSASVSVGPAVSSGINSTSGSLTVNENLTDFGRTRTAIVAARASLQAARADLLTKQEDVALQVSQLYFTAIANERLASIENDSVAAQQKHLEQAQGFYQEGTKARIDVAQAQSSLASEQLNQVKAENARDQSYLDLNNAMGLRTASAYQLDDTLLDDARQVEVESSVEQAYQHRPELLKFQAQVAAAQAAVDLARLGLNPTLASSGSVSYLSSLGQSSSIWSVGVLLNIPLLDSEHTRYEVQLAQAQLRTLLAQGESLKNSVFQQVQQDVLTLREARKSVTVAQAGLDAAAEAFRLAEGRYRAGLGSSIEFIDAQVAYSKARSDLVVNQVSVRVARSQLDRALGRTDFIVEVGNP